MAAVSGESVVQHLLSSGSENQQRLAAQEFMGRELAEARRRAETPAPVKNERPSEVVKLDVSTYSGEGAKRMTLNRWFCEIDMAIAARQLTSEFARTSFLISKLSGKAKEWALGRVVADPSSFTTLDAIKDDLRLAFEPPQDEAQHRTTFLGLKQGRMSMRDYVQRARQLVSCIVKNPIDMTTQVHVFITGMNAGFQRFYLTRKTPASLEEAFSIALREDYSVTASQTFAFPSAARDSTAEPMEVDAVSTQQHTRGRGGGRGLGRGGGRLGNAGGRFNGTCFRCHKPGHRAAECRAPAPVLAIVECDDAAAPEQSKNGSDQ